MNTARANIEKDIRQGQRTDIEHLANVKKSKDYDGGNSLAELSDNITKLAASRFANADNIRNCNDRRANTQKDIRAGKTLCKY